jgi:hypothetical protein
MTETKRRLRRIALVLAYGFAVLALDYWATH